MMNRNLRALVEWASEGRRVLTEGGVTFYTIGSGRNAKDAFADARAQAWADLDDDERDDGYTGTIYEKRSFVLIDLPKGKDPMKYAQELISKEDPRVDDKWGPAGAIDLGGNKFLFFGWASS